MIGLYPLVLVAVVIVMARSRGRAGGRGWRWFATWTAAGALFTFSLLSGFSIGLFILPFAAGGLIFVGARSPHLAESLGFVAGVGALALVVAAGNRDYTPCGPHGELSLPPDAAPGSVSCGGGDPTPWLVAGVILFGAALLAYALAARLRRGQTPAQDRHRSVT
ncbi:MAG: hypothetical protein WD689_03640 [Gaiellaceae bacterium]